MEILNQFGVQPILLAAQVVNFLILLLILKRFLYKPILKVLDERKQRIETSLRNVEEIDKRLAQTNEKVEKILEEALNEAQKIINESKEVGVQIIEESQKTAAEIINKALEQAQEVKKAENLKLQQEIRENLGNLVALALEKVTGREITGEDQKKLIEKSIKNIS